jgi:hypothetical protein
VNKYISTDKKYTITAIPVTTRRFGPSGSLINKNMPLEHTIAVMARISNKIFFDLKSIFVIFICSWIESGNYKINAKSLKLLFKYKSAFKKIRN